MMALDVETDLQRRLLEGLLGEKHREAYLNNAAFHYHIDMLVRMLPLWVDGIAAECDMAEEERREAEWMAKMRAYQFPTTPRGVAELREQLNGQDTPTGPDTPGRPDSR